MCECFSSVKNFVKFPYLHIRSFRRKQLSVRGFNNIVSRRATGSHRGGGGGETSLNSTSFKKKLSLDCQTRQAKSSLELTNLPGAQALNETPSVRTKT